MNKFALETVGGSIQQSPGRARENLLLIEMEAYHLMVTDVTGTLETVMGRCNALDWSAIPTKPISNPSRNYQAPTMAYYRESHTGIDGAPQPPGGAIGGGAWNPTAVLQTILYTNTTSELGFLPRQHPIFSFQLSWAYNNLGSYANQYFALRGRGRTFPGFPCFFGEGEIYGEKPSATNGGLGQIGVRNILQQLPNDTLGFRRMQEIDLPSVGGVLGKIKFLIPAIEFADWVPLTGTFIST